jgi:hypothetical protein
LLGRFPVEAEAGAVAAYRRAVGLASAEAVPKTGSVPPLFPVTWLGRPDVRAAVYAVLGTERLPVQTGQTMTFGPPVVAGGRYLLALSCRSLADDRMEFSAVVEAPDGVLVADMRIEILMLAGDAGEQG